MEPFLIYILKSACILSIFYAAYFFLLKEETSFEKNRKFLLGGLFAALILPSVYFTKNVIEDSISLPISDSAFSQAEIAGPELVTNWWMVAGILYFAVFIILLLRLTFQLYQIFRLINTLPQQTSGKFRYVQSSKEIGPFSFFNYIIFNRNLHSEDELNLILKHERVHATQMHSLDILLSNIFGCILWFNPITRLYKKSIVQNLEFIADRETVETCSSKKDYLKTLVGVSFKNLQPPLTNSFYKSFIKKRIIMLHKKKTSAAGWRFAMVLPAILSFILVFNVETKVYAQEKTRIISSNLEVLIDFDASTNKDDLEGYTALMAEYDVILKFNNLSFNKEGALTNITVEFIDKSNVSSGTVTKSKADGIEPFRYIYNTEEGSRFTTPKAHAPVSPPTKTKNIRLQVNSTTAGPDPNFLNKSEDAPDPIYILNGRLIKNNASIKTLDPNSIESVDVLKGEAAVLKYGGKAKDGAILISTRKVADSSGIINYTYVTREAAKSDSLKGSRNLFKSVRSHDSINTEKRLIITNEMRFVRDSIQKGDRTFNLRDNKNKNSDSPLVVLDGEIQSTDFNTNSLDPSNINAINVIKGESAVSKYGEKGLGGVIEISLKEKKK